MRRRGDASACAVTVSKSEPEISFTSVIASGYRRTGRAGPPFEVRPSACRRASARRGAFRPTAHVIAPLDEPGLVARTAPVGTCAGHHGLLDSGPESGSCRGAEMLLELLPAFGHKVCNLAVRDLPE